MAQSTAISYVSVFIKMITLALSDLSQSVSNLVDLNEEEREQIWQWNSAMPPTIGQGMHEIIAAQSRKCPKSPAVTSWDGELTYGELDQFSTQLARSLLSLGVELNIVPVCFEKSMWTVVAVLAIMKAGGAFVLMDPSQPEARLRSIVGQVEPNVMLTSQTQHSLASRLTHDEKITVVAPPIIAGISKIELPSVPASAMLYVVFTSGSTGEPKGVVISHASYTSGALPRAQIVGYKTTSRVLDFASYAFDVSIDCMLCTLAQGGCICVPSDEQRVNDLSGAIRDMNVNMAHMTPSVARVLDEETLSSLEVLGLGGESVTSGDAASWTPLTRIIIAYGPSECTVGCTVNGNVVANGRNPSIGYGVGGVTWIVDPLDHNRLMPLGSVGELLIEGPIVGQGYLNNAAKSSEVFISDPTWLLQGSVKKSGRQGRLYKTGDLAKYDIDGSIIFAGRKDTQVKLRGQRVELSEVEHHLRLHLSSWTEVAAEVITPKADDAKPTLVAFVTTQPLEKLVTGNETDQKVDEACTAKFSSVFAEHLSGIDKKLAETLPVYMIPSAYLPVEKMPMMVSGKLDRKRLREIGSAMSPRELAALRATGTKLSRPQTATEGKLQKVWSQLFRIDMENISTSDNFFSLGGDSILAMKLVTEARKEGLGLTVQDVFAHAQLSGMALVAVSSDIGTETDVPTFSLLEPGWEADVARAEVADLCGVDPSSVEDIYPCTPLQEGLMALSAKRTEAYVAQRVMELPDLSTEILLREAWEITVLECAVLRTRIVYVEGRGLMQVIVKENISWACDDDLDEYIQKDQQSAMQLGMQLARYGIVFNEITGKRHFIWTIHHSLYDGWSMPLIMDRVKRAYLGLSTTRAAQFKTFIRYLSNMDREASKSFWLNELHGVNGEQFPALPSRGYEPRASALLERYVPLTRRTTSKITKSTIIRGAWALVAGQLMGSGDVVFGETLIGRNVPIVGVDEIEGPMITTIPVRVRLHRSTPTQEFLEALNNEAILRMPHEHFGLQHIRRLSPDAQIACDLRTGLVIQPSTTADSPDEVLGGGLAPVTDLEAAREALHFNSYGLMLVCSLDADGFLIMASFDANMVEIPQMERILEQLDFAVQHLSQEVMIPIGEVLSLDKQDGAYQFRVQGVQEPKPPSPEPELQYRAPQTTMESKLQQLWARTLGIDADEISVHDNFFRLGADSITAMKLVAAVRLEGLTLTVAQIFRYPQLSEMAVALGVFNPSQIKAHISYSPYSALDIADVSTFLSQAIRPALADPTWKVQDVLPTTTLQEGAVDATIAAPRFSVQYNLMYLDRSIDRVRLIEKCQDLVVHHEILRTVFVKHSGSCLAVVLEELKIPVEYYQTEDDLEIFSREICNADAETEQPLGTSFVKIISVTGNGKNTQNCIIIRISHAQYDGICLPNLFLELKALYEGAIIPKVPPYSSYIYHITKENILESRQHWRKLLQGASMSEIRSRSGWNNGAGISTKPSAVSKNVDISGRPKDTTTATLLTAAWSIVLARFLSSRDVTFGQVVAGRNLEIEDCDKIMGPCDNHNAVRVKFQPGCTSLDLLRYVQDQHANNGPFEHTQLRDIIKHCTNWPSNTAFDSVVHHQDIDYFDDMKFGEANCRLDAMNPHSEPAAEWKVQSYSRDGQLYIEIVSSESWKDLAALLLDGLCRVITDICQKPHAPIFP